MRAVRFDEYGDESVLKVVQVPDPVPGPREVIVRVVTAGTNPGEIGIRSGASKDLFPAHFPEGQGSDLAGFVVAVGDEVSEIGIDEPVIGLSDGRNAQAQFVALPADRVVRKSEALAWDVAATLYVSGTTALAMLQAVPAEAEATVVIAGATGGVGVFLTQLAVGNGARVIAVSGGSQDDWLRAHGAEPVRYGDGLDQRLREAAPDGIAAFYDCHGGGYTDLAVGLGVAPERVETIIDYGAKERLGVHADGMAALRDPREGVRELAAIASEGGFEVPIKARYPLDQVQEAYRDLARRSGLGKIVLEVSEP